MIGPTGARGLRVIVKPGLRDDIEDVVTNLRAEAAGRSNAPVCQQIGIAER